MTNTFSNRQKYTIRQSAVTKNEKGMRTQLKAMAIVLTIAFAVAAGAAVWVSALVKNRSAESHVSALPVAVNAQLPEQLSRSFRATARAATAMTGHTAPIRAVPKSPVTTTSAKSSTPSRRPASHPEPTMLS